MIDFSATVASGSQAGRVVVFNHSFGADANTFGGHMFELGVAFQGN